MGIGQGRGRGRSTSLRCADRGIPRIGLAGPTRENVGKPPDSPKGTRTRAMRIENTVRGTEPKYVMIIGPQTVVASALMLWELLADTALRLWGYTHTQHKEDPPAKQKKTKQDGHHVSVIGMVAVVLHVGYLSIAAPRKLVSGRPKYLTDIRRRHVISKSGHRPISVWRMRRAHGTGGHGNPKGWLSVWF